jgi:pimeloyl-ACP methyl ester carboxylesterase
MCPAPTIPGSGPVILFLHGPGERGGMGCSAMAALDAVMAEYATDPDRVYLTGISMGGNGSWYLAYRHPDRFAAGVPLCGWVESHPRFSSDQVVPSQDGEPFRALRGGWAGSRSGSSRAARTLRCLWSSPAGPLGLDRRLRVASGTVTERVVVPRGAPFALFLPSRQILVLWPIAPPRGKKQPRCTGEPHRGPALKTN